MTVSDDRTTTVAVADDVVADLARNITGAVLRPDDEEFAREIVTFNVAHLTRPLVAVVADSAADVATAVRWAAARGLPVAVHGSGHGTVEAYEGGVLVCMHRMAGVAVDAGARTARIGGGAKWAQVLPHVAAHGLAPLVGSTSDVSVGGYLSGGGLPVLVRTFGFAADRVRSVEIVTADGVVREVDAEHDPELFWGVRGGKCNFGVITAVEIDLLALDSIYAGFLCYPGAAAGAVLHAWREWTRDVPDAMNSSVALMRLPDLPMVPEPLRGQFVVQLRIAYVGAAEDGDRLIAPLRAAAPVIVDTVAPMPCAELDHVHNDPTHPLPSWHRGGLLHELAAETVDALLAVAGPEADTPLLMVELRQLGGVLPRQPERPSAAPGRDAAFAVFVLGLMPPELRAVMPAAGAAVYDALAPWSTGSSVINFIGDMATPEAAEPWSGETLTRLAALKARVDPGDVFRFGYHVAPATVPAPR